MSKKVLDKIKTWLQDNIDNCDNETLIEDNRNLLNYIKKWENENDKTK